MHEKFHVANVVISSMPLHPCLLDSLPSQIRPLQDVDQDFLVCLSSATSGQQSSGPSTVHIAFIPLIPGYFSGVGDLFSALVLGHFQPSDDVLVPSQTTLSLATSIALTKTHAVLSRTYSYSQSLPESERQYTDEEKDNDDPTRRYRRMKGRELRLVQCQDILRDAETGNKIRMELWDNFW
jgi:pyridoxine kinase